MAHTKRSLTRSAVDTVRSNVAVQAALCVAFGLLLIIMPGTAALTVVRLLGIFFLLSGAVSLFSYFHKGGAQEGSTSVLATGIVYLACALIVFIFTKPIASVLSFILGILLLIGGAVNIFRSLSLKEYGGPSWVVMLVMSCIVTAGGVLITINPFGATQAFVVVLGIFLVLKGISDFGLERIFVIDTK